MTGEQLFISGENFLFGDVSIQACPRLIPIIALPHYVFRPRLIGSDTVIISAAFFAGDERRKGKFERGFVFELRFIGG